MRLDYITKFYVKFLPSLKQFHLNNIQLKVFHKCKELHYFNYLTYFK